jgi:uncharacterized membrane protein
MGWTHDHAYAFLVWNLFLAWVPFACALAVREGHRRQMRGGLLLVPFFAWLAFLPNAPYLVTDFMHLRWREGAPLWFDAIMLASFAWAGVGLGVASLRMCSRVVEERRGQWLAALFVVLSGFATGFGIYLGRFIRFNTWDVLTRPLAVLHVSLSPIVHPFEHPHAWVFTATFGLFFLTAYGVPRLPSTAGARSL